MSESRLKPRIGITPGDPAGVGPELTLRLCPLVADIASPVIFGYQAVLARVANQLSLPLPPVMAYRDWLVEYDSVTQPTLVDLPTDEDLAAIQPGKISSATGRLAYQSVDQAIACAQAGRIAGMATGPLHKEALHAAEIPFPGHTEILQTKTESEKICMMLTSQEITCALVTTHVGLAEVPGLLTTQGILDIIELSHEAMRRIRDRDVQLVVCGLNPHAGENGLFGDDEEARIIQPAIQRARERGIAVRGPLPPDTAFLPAIRQATDCFVCMYHDQGLIPLKALAFDTGVNVTLGLPIVRTSVDHGTALDIAWQGRAEVSSFVEAVRLAVKLAGESESVA